MKDALAALYQLQLVDTAVMRAEARYRGLDHGTVEKSALDEAQSEWQAKSQQLHETSANLHDAELEQKTVEAKRKEFETKLYSGKVSAPKELQAMSDEIEALGRQRGRLDERILELMEVIQEHKSEEAVAKAALNEAQAAFDVKATAFQADEVEWRTKVLKLRARRERDAKAVEPRLLKRYEAIRAGKRGVGLSVLEPNGDCGGCKTNQPMAAIDGVEKGAVIVTCENCGRILCQAPAA